MDLTTCATLFLTLSFGTVYGEILVQPEQVHLAYGKLPSQMVVTWTTMNKSEPSIVEYGYTINDLKFTKQGQDAILFTDGGPEHRSMYIHTVVLESLQPNQTYFYHVGNNKGWSNMFYFRAMKNGSDWNPKFAIYGDLGNDNAQSLSYLQEEAQKGYYDAVIHAGDFAYDMADDNAKVGDAFMNQIQPIAAYVPYMTCPGNHEYHYNFLNYRKRFKMPTDDGRKLFFSFDIGVAHVVSVSTEAYFYDELHLYGGVEAIRSQYKWLEMDLTLANKPENRAVRPWIITVGHRPLYCSNNDSDHCEFPLTNAARIGIYNNKTGEHLPGLEDIFYKYGVDLQIYAHEHNYERLYPIYNMTICNGYTSPYIDPRAPIHIITGSGGNREDPDTSGFRQFDYSAFHAEDYGYTRMNILNSTHLYGEQVSINKNGQVIDKFLIIKNKHGAGLYDCHKTLK